MCKFLRTLHGTKYLAFFVYLNNIYSISSTGMPLQTITQLLSEYYNDLQHVIRYFFIEDMDVDFVGVEQALDAMFWLRAYEINARTTLHESLVAVGATSDLMSTTAVIYTQIDETFDEFDAWIRNCPTTLHVSEDFIHGYSMQPGWPQVQLSAQVQLTLDTIAAISSDHTDAAAFL
jgi:hypothetical protein